MTEEIKKKPSVLDNLRALFDSLKLSKVMRASAESKKLPTKENAEKRRAARAAWAKAQDGQGKMVACCPKCRAWFPSTAERNACRAGHLRAV